MRGMGLVGRVFVVVVVVVWVTVVVVMMMKRCMCAVTHVHNKQKYSSPCFSHTHLVPLLFLNTSIPLAFPTHIYSPCFSHNQFPLLFTQGCRPESKEQCPSAEPYLSNFVSFQCSAPTEYNEMATLVLTTQDDAIRYVFLCGAYVGFFRLHIYVVCVNGRVSYMCVCANMCM